MSQPRPLDVFEPRRPRRLACIVALAALFLLSGLVEAEESDKDDSSTPAWAHVSPKQIEAAKALGLPAAIETDMGLRLVLIPAGEYWMGTSKLEAARVETYVERALVPSARRIKGETRHRVRLSRPFYMGYSEVTNAQFKKMRPWHKSDKHAPSRKLLQKHNAPNFPVTFVTHGDAVEFCRWLSKKSGKVYRLPTEAEWEYACRAGTDSAFHSGRWPSYDGVNFSGVLPTEAAGSRRRPDGVLPVASLKPNPWGLYDMHGNLAEWCSDTWTPDLGTKPQTDPKGPKKPTDRRVLRGGTWWHSWPYARSAARYHGHILAANNVYGFRVVLEIEKPKKSGDSAANPQAPPRSPHPDRTGPHK